MQLTGIEGGNGTIIQGEEAGALVAECLAAYELGSIDALYDLGKLEQSTVQATRALRRAEQNVEAGD